MGNSKYNPASAFNITIAGQVGHTHIKKKTDILTRNYIANQDSQEIVIPRNIMEQIYNIPSSIKKEWNRMSKAEKFVYGAIFASTVIGLGIATDYKFNDGKVVKKFADTGKKVGKAVTAGASGFFTLNYVPIIENIAANKSKIRAGDAVKIEAKVSDRDGDTIKYNWQILKDGYEMRTETTLDPALEEVFDLPGKYSVRLEAVDDHGKKDTSEFRLEVEEAFHQFTNGIEVIGSDSYKQKIQERLEELDTTPNFKIRDMTARQYTEKYLDYLYEAVPGTKESCPSEAIGKKATECLSEDMASASNLLHVARHMEQNYELEDIFKDKPSYELEKDAVKFESEWFAAKNNWSEEQRVYWFENTMKQYEVWKPK